MKSYIVIVEKAKAAKSLCNKTALLSDHNLTLTEEIKNFIIL